MGACGAKYDDSSQCEFLNSELVYSFLTNIAQNQEVIYNGSTVPHTSAWSKENPKGDEPLMLDVESTYSGGL